LPKLKFLPIAHRGGNTDFPENTIASFKKALELGYTCIETDVQVSLDKVVYVYHDSDFKRLLDIDKKVSDTRSEEIDTYLLAGEHKIPRLQEILDQFPETIFSIDAKSWDVVDPLADIIKESNSMSRVYIASFSDRRVRYLSKILDGKVKTVAGTSQVIKFIIGFLTGFRFSFSADFIQVPEKKFGIKLVSHRSIQYAKRIKIPIHVWTVNDQDKMASLIQLGVNGIMTDECEKLKLVLEKSI
tara:strand:- start:911 stop:1639 length:729 start_codon:yes stop_codon:yes gene_type:complete